MLDHGEHGAVSYQAPGRCDEAGHMKAGEVSQLDYIMVSSCMNSGIQDAWSDWTCNLDSDHFQVVASLQCLFKKPQQMETNSQGTDYSSK